MSLARPSRGKAAMLTVLASRSNSAKQDNITEEQYNSPSVATVVAGIASSANIAEGDDIIRIGYKATQEHKGQHSTCACKH